MAEYHKDQLPEDGIHVAIRWRVMDQAARDALVLTDADVGGLLVQDDVMSLFVLLSAAPVTWSQVPDGDSTLAAILAVNAEVLERVEGPATANDNAIALFDGSTGKLIKESVASIDSLGNITTGGMVDGVDISNLAMALALVAVPDYVTLSSTPTLGNERVLTQGAGITITDGGPGGAVTVASTVTAGAPVGASYLTLGTDATLTSERVLTQGAGIAFTDGGAGGALTINKNMPINTQTSAYTLVLADAGKHIQIYSASAVALTIPANASVALPVGTEIFVTQTNLGSVSLSLDTGVTLLADNHRDATGPLASVVSLSGLYATVRLLKQAANQWVANGDLVPYVNTVAGIAYTLVSGDIGNIVTTTSASAAIITIPLSGAAAPVGCRLTIAQLGAGLVTLSPAASVTLNVPSGFVAKTRGQYSEVVLTKVAVDAWDISGDLEGAAPFTLNNQLGIGYTLVLADAAKCVTMGYGAANTLTIPANASVAFPIGTVITVMQLGVGQTTIAITTDTLNNPALTAKLRARYSVASLTKITATSWVLSGDLAAS